MPSYRVELEIGALRPRRAPEEVMDVAVVSLGALHVDATDLKVSDGTPLILALLTDPWVISDLGGRVGGRRG